MQHRPTKAPLGVSPWLAACVLGSFAGWLLSAFRALSTVGYLVFFGALLALIFVAPKERLKEEFSWPSWRRLKRRFRRWQPAAFLVLSALAFLGGALHAPNNYDALSYRTPRVLNWLAEGRWHWIHTEFNRLNTRGTAFEWLTAPILSWTASDRLFFLINAVSFLLLPGLIYSLFTRLGVPKRSAWHWMWIVPTGYCFLLQAGSIGNDLFGAVFALAAMDFAMRARASGSVRDVWLSIMAAALLSSKASNLPLLLPWAVAIAPSLPSLRKRLATTAAILLLTATASLVPTAIANVMHSGDWTGLRAEKIDAMEHGSALNVANNSVLLVIQNLAPPIFPLSVKWNQAVDKWMPENLKQRLRRTFEPGGGPVVSW